MRQTNKKTKVLFIILLLVVNMGAGLIGYSIYEVYLHKYEVHLSSGKIEAASIHDLKEQVQEEADDSMMKISMNVKPVFTEEGKNGNLFITNSVKNKYDIQVLIKLSDSDKTVFESDIVRPGAILPSCGLQEKLASGSYDAQATIQFYDHGQQVTESVIDMNLYVKN